jgi:hypothetical protein
MADLPAYLAPNGLLRYWPGDRMPGSVALTAYALSITAEAGLPWPDSTKGRLLDSMRAVVEGRLNEQGEGPADARLLRIAAAAALARNGASSPQLLQRALIPLRDMPTATLADWIVAIERTNGIRAAFRVAAEQALRGRIVFEGTRLDLTDVKASPWWMMVSGDEMALRALVAVIGRPGWNQDAPRMMVGAALRQQRGHWDTTPANAWGTIATRRFAALYLGAPVGVTTMHFGPQVESREWPRPAPVQFPLPAAPTPLVFQHGAGAQPWAFVSVRAAVPLKAPVFSGYRVTREIGFLQRKRPDRLSRGDVLKVRLTIDAPVDRTWVVVDDPLPAGASIVSGAGQSALLAEQANGGSGVWPSYVERGLGAWRGFFAWLPQGHTVVEYAVRLNSTGRFQLPPTRVVAMYSPEIHASLPNGPLAIDP